MHFTGAAALVLIALASSAPLVAQGAPAGAASTPAADNTALLDSIRQRLRDHYVLPATGEALVAALTQAERDGRFSGLAGRELAAAVNAVMREVTPDGHLSLMHDPGMAAMLTEYPEGGADDAEEVPPQQQRMIALNNGGVRKLEVLPGNIRYMDYGGFMWGSPAAQAAIDNAMEFLAGGSAAIIDLRRNGGGSPEAVAALASYFLPEGTPLMRFEMRGRSDQATSAGATPFKINGIPVYVLTSRQSVSAAEEFAAHADAFGFATLVGETTGGAGFRATLYAEPGGFVLSVSTGQAIQVKSGKGWERTGIAPAVAVPADRALDMARAEAIAALIETAPDGERQAYERLLPVYRALAAGAQAAHPLAAYAGSFGERVVAVDAAGNLTSSRGGMQPTRLVALGGDLFTPEAAPGQQFRFVFEGDTAAALEVDGGAAVPRG